ncbi:DNA internalization-related competence protein ComEC/Rec2 [Pseudomonas tohonis]|uniref:DNA internalization-related competence protein ComEC/Rec2 n=1 Tax=Pseudomonas tohonis TaxID=2725477 RepID=UPI001F179256|nr:DNA internalization-related competence protein ComEC/Rec2 [Pseudomonas tohonis]
MAWALVALGSGLAAVRFMPALPPTAWLLVAAALGLALLAGRGRAPGLFLLGIAWGCCCAQWALDDRLDPSLDGETRWLEGRVVGLPQRGSGVVRFELDDPQMPGTELPSRIRLSWYGGPQLRGGEHWRLAVTLKRPRGLVNPHAFDYEAWLLARHTGASGSVKAGKPLASGTGPAAWRDRLRQGIDQAPAHGRNGGISALVLGDGSGLTPADWRLLQDTGTVHLMVISGQHIALLAAVLYGAVALLARIGLWPGRLPWLPCACALALVGSLGYGFLAGFDVPVQRACLMTAIALLWRLRFRHLGVVRPLLVAFCVVLAADPLASLQAGFWLSFGAVALLILIFAGRMGVPPWWLSWWRAQWTMGLALSPLLLALALPISLSGPLANLVAVPWVSLVSVPLSLLGAALQGVPWLGTGLLWLAGGSLELLFRLLAWIAAWIPAWQATAVPPWAWLLGMGGCLLLVLPAGVPVRVLGVALLLPALFPPLERPPWGRADIWLLDVGQGLSVLVRTREHALLYDTGARRGDFDMGERVVLPSLLGLGVRQLDQLLLSHADNDHAGGAGAVLRGMPVERVVSGEPLRLPAALGAQACGNEAWEWDGVRLRTWRWDQARSGNDRSCVLSVEAQGERIHLTGDIGIQAEAAWIASGEPLRADWLLAPHHGSASSSSAALIEAVSPRGALITRGSHNAFGHPHPSVVARYRASGVAIHDTAESGALLIRLGERDEVRGLRTQARFWREK